jgi:glycosyltransferase involved in cell wall biosynthesis
MAFNNRVKRLVRGCLVKRLKILLSSYTCIPGAGGEDAVGWRWVVNLSQRHDVTVLTYSDRKVARIQQDQDKTSARFVYVNLPDWLERIDHIRGVPRRLHYGLWQLLAGRVAQQLHQQEGFDLVHHVVYNQFRTPTFGDRLGIPFVFGPVGGAETVPPALFADLQWGTRLKEIARRWELGLRQLRSPQPNPHTAYVFSNPATQRVVLGNHPHPHNHLMPAIYVDEGDLQVVDFDAELPTVPVPEGTLRLVMPGRMLDWKGPLLALRALAEARDRGCALHLHIVGEIVLEQQIRQLCQDLHLEDVVQITSYMPRRQLLKLIHDADALFYAAFRDSGAMVVAESYLLEKPAIILDIDSQFHIQPQFGIKATVGNTYAETVAHLANALQWAAEHRDALPAMGATGKAHLLKTLSWAGKVQQMEAIYGQLLGESEGASANESSEESLVETSNQSSTF